MFKENYNITLEEAKSMDGYKFSLKDGKVLEKYKVSFNEIAEEDDNYYGGEEVLEFYNIDIELNITKRSSENMKNILDFYVCVKGDNGWNSHDFSEYELKYDDLKDIDTLERVMFREMMRYAEKYNLYWSRKNN